MIMGMRAHIWSCARCGSILDAPRANPGTGEIAHKCCDCDRWQPLRAGESRAQERLPRPYIRRIPWPSSFVVFDL
jgi:hypothetical protein